ncbi:hypothetical protein Tco_0066375 [Tanacetum coccineum]
MGVSHDLRGDSWGCVPRSLFCREDLGGDGERGFDCLTFALVSSKAHREGCRASRGGFPYWGSAYVPKLLLSANKLDKKSFKDKVPLHPEMDPLMYSDDPSYGEDEQNLVGPSLPPHPEVVGEASTPLDVDNDYDIHAKELRDATDCHWVVAHAILDNLDKDRAYAELERKCNEALQDLNKNLLAKIEDIKSERERPKSSEIQLLHKIDSLKQDKAAVVSKVISDAAMKLVRSDDLGVLIAKLVRSSIIYG